MLLFGIIFYKYLSEYYKSKIKLYIDNLKKVLKSVDSNLKKYKVVFNFNNWILNLIIDITKLDITIYNNCT